MSIIMDGVRGLYTKEKLTNICAVGGGAFAACFWNTSLKTTAIVGAVFGFLHIFLHDWPDASEKEFPYPLLCVLESTLVGSLTLGNALIGAIAAKSFFALWNFLKF
ncbi:MAG: hypothetical protein WCP39_04270 [Chlamydiota bacterium]